MKGDLQPAIDYYGNLRRLSIALGLPYMNVYQWSKRKIPAIWAMKIETMSNGEIKAAQMRPDIFGQV